MSRLYPPCEDLMIKIRVLMSNECVMEHIDMGMYVDIYIYIHTYIPVIIIWPGGVSSHKGYIYEYAYIWSIDLFSPWARFEY